MYSRGECKIVFKQNKSTVVEQIKVQSHKEIDRRVIRELIEVYLLWDK